MQAAWRLATSGLSGRWLRTALLAAAVAMSTALIVAVSCAMQSADAGMRLRVASAVGAADAIVRHVGRSAFDTSVLDIVRAWPGVRIAAARSRGPIPLRNPRNDVTSVAAGVGIDPANDASLRTPLLREGEPVSGDGQIVLDPRIADELAAGPGETLEVQRIGEPMTLLVVGVASPPPFATMSRPEGLVTLDTLARVTGESGRLSEIDIALTDPARAAEFVAQRQPELPAGLLLEPSVRISSGLDRNMRANTVTLVLASVLAFLAASFIILTGLTTSVLETQRELAIVRCVGGSRGQIAAGQLFIGAVIGGAGALVGAPLGVALAWIATLLFPQHLPAGLHVSPIGVALAAAGAVASGLLGAAWPAVRAACAAPLTALASRARPTRARWLVASGAVGAALAALEVLLARGSSDGQVVFWTYALLGAPIMFIGWFLLSAPVTMIVARLAAPALSRLLRLPHGLLAGAVRATPIRHGFTAGSLMAGLALLTALWTTGSALLRDWLGAIQFPDAFVQAIGGSMSEADLRAIRALPSVRDSCAVTLMPVDAEAFGVRALRKVGVTFVGFEPAPFFRMTRLDWIEGDPATAAFRLERGGAILIAREFRVARGLGLGDHFAVSFEGKEFDFEIVGVVDSPGLDIASRYFDIGDDYARQSIHAIFGSRRDMVEKFGNTAVNLVQLRIAPGVDDEAAVAAIRRALKGTLLAAGSGREIKGAIERIGESTMTIVSLVAIAAIVIACFGVANIVIAGVDARRFEFGVLRAVGAEGSLLARLVVGEVLIVILAACVVGAALGVQGAWNAIRLYRLLAGLTLSLRPPPGPILAGCAILAALTLAAAAPAAIAIARRKPRELLGATRG